MSDKTLIQLANEKYESFKIGKKREAFKDLLLSNGFHLINDERDCDNKKQVLIFKPILGVYCRITISEDGESFYVDLYWLNSYSDEYYELQDAEFYFATQDFTFSWLIEAIEAAIEKAEI